VGQQQGLVLGGQLDAYLALAGIVAILISRRGSSVWHDIPAGILAGVAGGIKITAVFVGFGIAVPLLRERAWWRLVRTGAAAMATTAALYGFSYGLHAPWPAFRDSTMVTARRGGGWRRSPSTTSTPRTRPGSPPFSGTCGRR
jgi:hypothetical protein